MTERIVGTTSIEGRLTKGLDDGKEMKGKQKEGEAMRGGHYSNSKLIFPSISQGGLGLRTLRKIPGLGMKQR